MLIGLDFDNTLIGYGHVFRELALERGLIPDTLPEDKVTIRGYVRKHHGDIRWQELQVETYGRQIHRGRFMDGAGAFIHACREHHVELRIVSHKTRYGSVDAGGCDMREAALGWMEANSFFNDVAAGGLGFARRHVFFAPTRAEKVATINELGCDVFVDDLVEVLGHPDLSPSVERILYTDELTQDECCAVAGPWSVISPHVLGGLI